MKTILAWAIFDLANTFFAVSMLSFYFPLWVVEDRGASELTLSLALGASMACVAVIMPFCGALADATGQPARFLRWSTVGCVTAMALMGGTAHVGVALVLFGVANLCYQVGTIFYDALLWRIAPPQRLGIISGVGASFGYLGSMVGLLVLWPFVRRGGHHAAFLPAAVCFLVLALPAFLVIRDAAAPSSIAWRALARAAMMRLAITIRSAKAMPGVWRFLWASFFSLCAIHTILVFMAVYTRKAMGFAEGDLIRFFLFSQLFAVGGALVLGRLMVRWGSRRTLARIWLGWVAALGVAAVGPPASSMWLIGPVMGFCLGATWATARVLLTELAPKDQLAEMFGLAGLFGKVASIVGPMVWGLVVGETSRYRPAILLLIGFLALGLWLLRRVPTVQQLEAG